MFNLLKMFRSNSVQCLQCEYLDQIVSLLTDIKKQQTEFREEIRQRDVTQNESLLVVDNLIDEMKGEPFAALKKWIDEATLLEHKFMNQRREFNLREQELLKRWESQVNSLNSEIERLKAK